MLNSLQEKGEMISHAANPEHFQPEEFEQHMTLRMM